MELGRKNLQAGKPPGTMKGSQAAQCRALHRLPARGLWLRAEVAGPSPLPWSLAGADWEELTQAPELTWTLKVL